MAKLFHRTKVVLLQWRLAGLDVQIHSYQIHYEQNFYRHLQNLLLQSDESKTKTKNVLQPLNQRRPLFKNVYFIVGCWITKQFEELLYTDNVNSFKNISLFGGLKSHLL